MKKINQLHIFKEYNRDTNVIHGNVKDKSVNECDIKEINTIDITLTKCILYSENNF